MNVPDSLPPPAALLASLCECACLTSDDCRYAPAHGVVEPHVSVVDIAQLGQHAVDVQPLHEHPGKGAHVEVMQEDGYDRTHKLEGGETKKGHVNPPIHGVCMTYTQTCTAKIY